MVTLVKLFSLLYTLLLCWIQQRYYFVGSNQWCNL